MTDVDITDAGSGDILKYNGATWVDGSLTIEEMTNVDTTVSVVVIFLNTMAAHG